MIRSIIIDTSPLVAFIDKSDDFHNWTIEVWKKNPIPLLTCEAVITEACFLLQNVYVVKMQSWHYLNGERFKLIFV